MHGILSRLRIEIDAGMLAPTETFGVGTNALEDVEAAIVEPKTWLTPPPPRFSDDSGEAPSCVFEAWADIA